ncbi:InlB B-repeat-containing protein [Fibrobacter sp. UWEL]|uniref:InlB B-repeat-containing protein n=1 Tax=Fibrobacter sp. UWEL TaxID=1896209 RepID=UPI000921FBB6|nr:InlB B-repeat-containing protein [Fibrobacter sp. UWEL]SHL25934.1 Por secretion system C-terminal sorting domain-containing protein [Fibrobacter sp. UWEL]
MKLRLSTIGASLLLLAGAASAVNGSGYYNLISVGGVYYLTQDANSCNVASQKVSVLGETLTTYAYTNPYPNTGYGVGYTMGVTNGKTGAELKSGWCTASAKDTPKNLYSLLKTSWIDAQGVWSITDLNLGSNLDLAGFDEDGKCVNPHKPLPTVVDKGIKGNGYTIKNLCYETDKMTGAVGFISEIKKGNYLNINFDGVKIAVKGTSKDGKDYYPVGTLAGVIDSANVGSIAVSNVSIDAPFAGGIVGLVSNATVANSRATENVSITNSLPITTGYAGSSTIDLATPYGVFLGGIAGVSTRSNAVKADASLKADTALVTVQDHATGHRSALGGAVGMIFASLDTYTGIHVISKDNEKTNISGGSAMGGIVGYSSILYVNNSQIAADTCTLKLENSSFTGEIGNASSLDDIAIGGLVGRDSVVSQTKLNIARSVADITLKDSLTTAGNYRYFAGGILGFSSNCTSAATDKDYLAIEKSVSKGSMELAGSDVAVSGLHAKAYMGGIAGAACFAAEAKALKEDTSSVKIVSKIKTTNDTLFVGGIVGSMNVGDNKGINLSVLSFTGSIAVEDSLNEIYAGGVVGLYLGASGGKPIGFKDISVSAKNPETSKRGDLITYSAKAESAPAGSVKKGVRLGGLCGYCREINNAEKISIYGNINVQAESKFVGDSLFVGGLVGRYENTVAEMVIQKTSTVGDIVVNGSGTLTKVGYLLGLGRLGSSYKFISNYHFGSDTDVDAFGFLTQSDISSIGSEITDWTTQESISYTIRNGETSTYGENANKNGTALASEMQSKSFAKLMNDPLSGTREDPYVWDYETGSNDGMPFLVGKNDKPVTNVTTYTVTFYLDDEETTSYAKRFPAEGEAVDLPENPVVEGYTFVGWDKAEYLTNVTSDMNVHAVLNKQTFTVTFFGYNKYTKDFTWMLVSHENVPYGSYEYPPNKDDYAEYIDVMEGMEFAGWDTDEYESVKSDLEIRPAYKPITYTVSFMNQDGSEAYSSIGVKYGSEINLPAAGTMAGNDSMTYIFKEWKADNDEVFATMPAKDLVFNAVYDSTRKEYTVAFLDYDGSPLGETLVKYGMKAEPIPYVGRDGVKLNSWKDTSVVITKPTTITADVSFKVKYVVAGEEKETWLPNGTNMKDAGEKSASRPATEKYTYIFTGWDNAFDVLTDSITYVAQFDSVVNEYTVTFLDYDGSPLGETLVKYGEKVTPPVYNAKDGVKLKSWKDTSAVITQTTTITAEVSFKVIYVVGETEKEVWVPNGSDMTDVGEQTASRPATEKYTYIFKGWNQEFDVLTDSITYVAKFDSVVNEYVVTFKDYNGGDLGTASVKYGEKVTPPEYKAEEGVRLNSWKDTSAVITQATTITADASILVTYVISDGDVETSWLPYGTNVKEVVGTKIVSRDATEKFTYEFTGWDEEFTTNLTAPVTYKAQFTEREIVASSSSSEPESSSSSSAIEQPESSSSEEIVVAEDVSVTMMKSLKQSGNAVLLTYAVDLSNVARKTEVYAVLVDEKGKSKKYPIADSLETERVENTFVIAPAPVGKNSVKLVVTNGVKTASSKAETFEVASEIAVAPKSWNMISLADAKDLTKLASSTSIYWWDEGNAIGDYWQYRAFDGGEFESARGFWYGSSVGKSIALREGVATSEFEWKLDSLYSGWNMVSNPTGWSVSLNGVLKNEDVLQVRSWNAETGAYDLATELKPYEAVWVQVKRPTRVTVDATPYFGAEEKNLTSAQKVAALRKGAARKASAKNWSVLAVLKDRSGKADSWNMIGAGSQEETLDKAPMGMGDYIRLAIMDGKNKLSKSVKAVADEYEWDMKLSAATARDAELSFDGVEALNQAGLAMTVTINGKTQEVKAGSPVKVALTKNSTVATVRVAPAATLASNKLTGFAVAQVADGLQIGFDAPESLAGANASYALVAVNGKKIASGSFKATAGTNSLNLKVPQSGLYFIQMKIGSQMASAKVMVK